MKKKIITGVIIALLIIGGGTFYFLSTRFEFNSDSATGNTAGNLNNGGLFCEYKDKIYFANPYDSNHLYVMNSDCTNAKMLNSDSVASINVCGNYIYYVKNNFNNKNIGSIFRGQLYGVYRTSLDGQKIHTLYDQLSGIISLSGNYLYYQRYSDTVPLSLYKAKIDGSSNKEVSKTPYNPASVKDKKIYFADDTNHNVISYLDTANDSVTKFFDANAYMVDAEENYIYYIDISKHYSLVRLNTSTKTVELLFDSEKNKGKIVNYNLYGNKIFIQFEGDEEHTGLYRMNADGTQVEYIASGNLTNIHCTSQYTFFQYFDNQGVLYRVPTSGAITKVEEITIK